MQRFIAIDHNSGFIWGDAHATSSEAACQEIDRQAQHPNAPAWEYVGLQITDTAGGFWLYAAPDDFQAIDDGTDADAITAVEMLPLVGCYRPVTA